MPPEAMRLAAMPIAEGTAAPTATAPPATTGASAPIRT